jgi:hypothetical protein
MDLFLQIKIEAQDALQKIYMKHLNNLILHEDTHQTKLNLFTPMDREDFNIPSEIFLSFTRSRQTKCESEFRRGTCTFRSKTTQELQNSRFQDANFPLNTFFRSQLCRITKN